MLDKHTHLAQEDRAYDEMLPGARRRSGTAIYHIGRQCPRRQAWLASAASAEGLRKMSKERSRKGPMPEGAHRDLTSDRGYGQGETGGATALSMH